VCSTPVTTFRVNIIKHTFNVTTQNTSHQKTSHTTTTRPLNQTASGNYDSEHR